MKITAITLLVFSLLTLGAPASAEEVLQSSRSAGKLKQDQGTDLRALLQQREVVIKAKPVQPENYAASGDDQYLAGIANRHDQLFEIYDADVGLVSDLDGDGYHHALNVYFDVDVSIDAATVYAKLYLSREGEPWSQYFTTDLFVIVDQFSNDAYEVETELVDGYPPGYYSILIEIYSLDHAHMVASEVLDYHYLGRDVPLEDLGWDEPFEAAHDELRVSVGAGSFTSILIFFLFIQVVIAARGALALTPLKKSD